uniref:Reverse transcriptase domain-containing protein n=1 Tax=Mycena chlorophos TaxID=658473 RepID=A0ABQ0L6L2_MYCCL|nr:predicted protein [Mycena chlorophos]
MDDSSIITEVMDAAPSSWNTVLNTESYDDLVQFQTAIRYHEDALLKLDSSDRDFRHPYATRDRTGQNGRGYNYPPNPPRTARVNLVGWSANLKAPAFPRDDLTVSKKATPESKGAHPCRHCGSGKHWDDECKFAYQGKRMARANLVSAMDEDLDAQNEYDDLYYELEGDSHGETSQQGFEEPLQTTEPLATRVDSNSEFLEENSALEGIPESLDSTRVPEVAAGKPPSADSRPECTSLSVKPALNRNTRRRLAREIRARNHHVVNSLEESERGPVVELRKHMARPPGSSFLGSSATETVATVNSLSADPIRVVIDSGSDITLISRKTLEELTDPPKIKAGHDVRLIQVTGKSSISGFVTLDLFFHTAEGPVKVNVDAYIVNGMTTPFILGNDFADQYSISILRDEGSTYLQFGSSERRLAVESSTSPSQIDEDGHTFQVRTAAGATHLRGPRASIHRRNQKHRRRQKGRSAKGEVIAAERVVILPETSIAVPVKAYFPKGCEALYVERQIRTNGNESDLYGAADTLISSEKPILHVANFSDKPVVIAPGQLLGRAHDPRKWLDRFGKYSAVQRSKIHAHAALLRTLVNDSVTSTSEVGVGREETVTRGSWDPIILTRVTGSASSVRSTTTITSKAQHNATGKDDPLAEEPVEGGPKTAEPPSESTASDKLLSEIDISPHVSPEQRCRLEEVVLRNANAFRLDGRLGNYAAQVEIPMKPGAEPVSLPPFPASPANREVIDRQMDAWIELGVIEPSKSPWAAPVFIVYRNSKPRMVIDLRKLNELVVPDEFPLPRQEDILQSLSGAQWLTTLDALAGFTQLTMAPSSAEKLAFRCHRGLWQFKRMPFGYRNGPGVFQRVMQNVLAPFLWIFALVYIDDIVIFSLTFDDHVRHLVPEPELASSRNTSKPRPRLSAPAAPTTRTSRSQERDRAPHLDLVVEQEVDEHGADGPGDEDTELTPELDLGTAVHVEPRSPSSPSSLTPSQAAATSRASSPDLVPVPVPIPIPPKPARMPKPPTLPLLTEQPGPLSISNWISVCTQAVELWKEFNPGVTLSTSTMVRLAGAALHHSDAQRWWSRNCEDLVKLNAFEDFTARLMDEFVDAGWRDKALIDFYAISQGADSYRGFVKRLKDARVVLQAAGGEYVIKDGVYRNHLFTLAHPVLRLSTMATPSFRIHSHRPETLVALMSSTWDILVASNKIVFSDRVAPRTVEPPAVPVAAPAAPRRPALSDAERQQLKDAGGCFRCRRKPGDPGWVKHTKDNCPDGRPPPTVAAVASSSSPFYDPDDSPDDDEDAYFRPGNPAPLGVNAVLPPLSAEDARWDSDSDS